MRICRIFLVGVAVALAATTLAAQSPVLSNIQAPYASIQSPVHVGGQSWGSGVVAYGPVGTPLILSGSDFGDSGTVKFIGYKNGAPDPGYTVQASVSLWTPAFLFVSIPNGATSGLIAVTSSGKTSNALPVVVTAGTTYASTCPAFPSNSQLQITTSALHDGQAGQTYSATLNATGGAPAYTWSLASGTLPNGLSLNSSTGVISGTPTVAFGPADLTVQVQDSASTKQTATVVLSLFITSSGTNAPIYSYSIPSSAGYDGAGNVLTYTDSVTGTWSMAGSGGSSGFDSLNRLVAAQSSSGPYQGLQATWGYDNFGNRMGENFGGNTSNATAPIPASTSATYNANNQVQSTSSGTVPQYDSAGDVTCDNFNSSTGQCVGQNRYLYDAEGRVCAVQNLSGGAMFGYLYDAEGMRVAKGTITSWNCNTATNPSTSQPYNGFENKASIILGPGNEQLTELTWGSGSGPQWAHTNVFAAGELMATYSPDPDTSQGIQAILNFHLTDWLGTHRVLVDSQGNIQATCLSLPYGNGETCTATPTEQLFAGLESDAESGLDHATFRQYGPMTGRWMSPDPYDGSIDASNPQSFNRYAYVGNMPMAFTDPSGQSFCGSAAALGVLATGGPIGPTATGVICAFEILGGSWIFDHLFGIHQHHLTAATKARPGAQPWDEHHIHYGANIGAALGLPDAGCEFGACGDIGNALAPGAGASANTFCSNHPTICGWANYLGTHPITISVNEIGAGQITYQHSTHTICANAGVGASWPPTKAVTAGVYNNGNMKNWTNVVSGWGYSFSASAGGGYQATINSSGTIGGPVVSLPGVSGSYTYGGCTTF